MSNEREARYAEAITNSDGDTLGSRAIRAVASAVMAVADAEREQDAATIAELRAEVERLRGVVEAHLDAGTLECPECGSGEEGCCVCHQMKRAESAEARLQTVEAVDRGRSEHHPKCFQSRPQGVPADLPRDLCDCKVLWMLEGAKAVAEGGTCPSQCVSLNHPGREHEQWASSTPPTVIAHD